MPGHEQIDRLFLTRAQDMRLLSRAQVLEVYHELGMRRYREPDLQAYEVVVEKGWLGADVAMTLLEAAPEEAGGAQSRMGSSPVLTPSDPEIPELTESELSIETEHDHFAGATEAGIGTETAGDLDEYDYSQVPKFVEPLAPSYAVADGGSSEDSVLEMELPPPESSSGDSLFEEPDSQPPIPPLDDDNLPEIVSERTPSVVYDGGPAESILDSSDTLDEIQALDEPESLQESLQEGLHDEEKSPAITARDWSDPGPGPGKDTERVKKGKGKGKKTKTKTRSKGKSKSGRNTTAREFAPGETAGRTASDLSDPGTSRTHQDSVSGEMAMPPAALFEVKGAKGADVDFASFGEDGELPQSEMIEESEDISVAMVDSAVSDVMDDADDAYFGVAADLTRTPAEVLEDSIAPPAPLHGTTLFDSSALANESDIVIADDESDFSATGAPVNEAETATEAMTPSQYIKDDSDVDFGATLPGEDSVDPPSSLDAADVGLTDVTDEATSLIPGQVVTTSSKTQFATGEMAQPGLGRSKSKVGVESNITGEEITLADLRQQMGLGAGVKLGGEQGALSRLRKVGGLKKRYSVVREIARGGMGKVIEVEDNDLRRSVALKVLRKEMLERKDLVQRFLEEAQITGQLEHPNIVPVHEIGVDGRGNLYFTMKLVEGEDLSSILKRMRKKDPSALKAYPISRLMEIFIKACEGIAYAHSKGVIHRDLKPANIMVGRYGEVQIMDWGVAKIIGRKEDTNARMVASDRQEDDASRTMAGSLLGTPSYMSPEQARGEVNNMGPTSDIFSLGVILFELLALKTPWTAQTSAAVLDQVKSYSPESPLKVAPERKIPPELDQLAMKCIEKRAEKRVQSVQDLIENLRSWQEGRTLAAVQYTVGQLLTKWISRHKVAIAAGLAIMLALVGGVVVATNFAKQGQRDRVEELVAKARAGLASAQSERKREEYEAAKKVASDAQIAATAARELDPESEDAVAVYMAVYLELNQIDSARENAEEEKARIEKQTEAQRALVEALGRAKGLLTEAENLFSTVAGDRSEVRVAYVKTQNEYQTVRGIDANNGEAIEALLYVANKIEMLDAEVRDRVDMERLERFVKQASVKVAEATALPSANEGEYEKVIPILNEAIVNCDKAGFIQVNNARAEDLRTQASELKAQAALDYARRALDLNKFDVCRLMLDLAQGTAAQKFGPQLVELDRAYVFKKDSESTYRRFVNEAAAALAAEDWPAAQIALRGAITEVKKNPSPERQSYQDTYLQPKLDYARVSQMNKDAAIAIASSKTNAMLRAIGQYNELIEGTDPVQGPDQRAAAIEGREKVRAEVIAQLQRDAAATKELPVREALLMEALGLVKEGDQALRSEVSNKLRAVREELAKGQGSGREVLLDREIYWVGSTRDSDQNPRRPVPYTDKFVFFDKYLVTNKEFKENFLDKGGYENAELWDKEALVLLPKFVDSTGKQGPSGWANGTYESSQAQYPVTGLSWYEARAYSRAYAVMSKKNHRLPTPEEWEIAAGAPITERDPPNEFGFARSKMAGFVPEPREVGTTSWDGTDQGIRDMGNNVAEWTGTVEDGKVVVKGAEPGIKTELFDRYARRAKNSFADPAERSGGRGFRCARDLTIDTKE